MKILSLLTLMFITSVFANAQTINLNILPDGSVTVNDAEFVVIPLEGSQSELFKRIKDNAVRYFNTSDSQIKEVDNELIRIESGIPELYKYAGRHPYGIKYFVTIDVKDNKIRLNAPVITSFYAIGKPADIQTCLGYWVYNKNGELKDNKTVESFQQGLDDWSKILQILFSDYSETEDDW